MRLALSALLVLAIGCRPQDKEPPRPKNVEIVNAGSEPRALLAYHAPKGTKVSIDVTTDAAVTADKQGGPLPTIALTYELEVKDVLPLGLMLVRMVVADSTARDRPESDLPAAAATHPVEETKGLAIVGLLSPDGELHQAHAETAANPAQQQIDDAVASFEQVALALPDVPVGAGAKWKSTRPVERGGMKMTATTTVELSKVAGTTITYATTSKLEGPDQTVSDNGMTMRLEHIAGEANGHGTVDLGKLAVTGELSASFKAEMSEENEKTPMQMTQKMTMTSR